MAALDRIKREAGSDDEIAWKYKSEAIRLGSQLIVNQSQEAVFFEGGKVLDTFGPGTHTLSTGNLPLLGRLINLPFGGETPFAAEIWFVNRTARRDLKWGTPGPVQVIDPVYNFPVSVRAFGTWGIRIVDSRSFLTQLVGSQVSSAGAMRNSYIGMDRVEDYFVGEIVQRLSDALARYFVEDGISVFQAGARLNRLSQFVAADITPEFSRFGIDIVNFNVQRVSIPDQEHVRFQEILGRRMEIDQIGQARLGPAYTAMRTFDTLEKAAGNEGSGAGQILGAGLGLGVGLGAGVPVGQQIGNAMNVDPQAASADPLKKLQKLKELLAAGLITQEEHDGKKKETLDSL